MKIMITGANGFLGSYLTRALITDGYEVIILKRSTSNDFRIYDLLSQLVSYDIDKVSLEQIFKEHYIDIVIHTATNYGKDSRNVSDVIDSNVVFPLKLLELLSNDGTAFINTDTFFNNNRSHLYNYLSSYSMSKKYFFELAEKFVLDKSPILINAKLEHLYGPKDDSSKFTMQIINKLIRNEPQLNLTLGNQERDFIYVDDVVLAYLFIIKNISKFNLKVTDVQVGTGITNSIKDFVELSKKIIGSTSELLFGSIPHRENEIFYSQADNDKLKSLGWNYTTTLDNGIEKIVNEILNVQKGRES